MLRKVGQRVVALTKGKQTPVCVMDGFPVHIHRMHYLLAEHSRTHGFALYEHGCACEPTFTECITCWPYIHTRVDLLCIHMDVHASHAAALN